MLNPSGTKKFNGEDAATGNASEEGEGRSGPVKLVFARVQGLIPPESTSREKQPVIGNNAFLLQRCRHVARRSATRELDENRRGEPSVRLVEAVEKPHAADHRDQPAKGEQSQPESHRSPSLLPSLPCASAESR